MAIVTGDRYLECLVKFVEKQAGPLIEGTLVLKLNPVGLHYVQLRLEALNELERLLAGAPVDYLRAYISDLGDHRAIEQLRRILRLLTSLKVVSVLPPPARDPTPLSLWPFERLKVLELRGCDLSTSAARGLLQLRHTLEKIICHNSTDALRHVFASRIADIKDCPQWNRLSFVSCACNGLILMDESLQLLPVVETLDLSRNKFSKVDNLRKCARLKLLDLGFNQLRNIASFIEVSCQLVKLVLRNNALTTLHGIENLMSLEGLDLSYNIISNFLELEVLAGLPNLESIWLEGNPLCSARWYREQVFSYFPHPKKLKLDGRQISTREFWKRRLIVASKQKRPASYGFYTPAKDGAEGYVGVNAKKKKVSRLACIESEDEGISIGSDLESMSCENENQSRLENGISDDEAEVVGLMNRVEYMKKERSVLWLREFQEWMVLSSGIEAEGSNYSLSMFNSSKENNIKKRQKNLGECSRCVSDSVLASGDESSMNFLESDNFYPDLSVGSHAQQYLDLMGEATPKLAGDTYTDSVPHVGRTDFYQKFKSHAHEGIKAFTVKNANSCLDASTVQRNNVVDSSLSVMPLSAIENFVKSCLTSAHPRSPPHYQVDILLRRHNLEEEILQLSVDSYSVASSDSISSNSEEDIFESRACLVEPEKSNDELLGRNSSMPDLESSDHGKEHEVSQIRENCISMSNCNEGQAPHASTLSNEKNSNQVCNVFLSGAHDGEIARSIKLEADWLEKKKFRRKPKKRIISLIGESILLGNTEQSYDLGNVDDYGDCLEDQRVRQILNGSSGRFFDVGSRLSFEMSQSPQIKDFIENYFNCNLADSGVRETCKDCILCSCLLEEEYGYKEREAAVLLSSEDKLYVLVIDGALDEIGLTLRTVSSLKVDEINEVLVGIGLQVLRVRIRGDTVFVFITRSMEKSRDLLYSLKIFDSFATCDSYFVRSLEPVQLESFEKNICRGAKLSIFQYSMVLFSCNNNGEDLWLSRSLFLAGGHLILCIEDLVQFSSISMDACSSPYFSLDLCCSIIDVSEMVIDSTESPCITLSLQRVASELYDPKGNDVNQFKKQSTCKSLTWKLKWFSEESLFKFVALLKALHAGATNSSFTVRCKS
ncbi:Leucine-rich repeat [Dillenia turbinata]|uniref:Leucine-rich repeat n=1 Tax=Dillenia turbinata TaxID=194707 RepID=A0AAN8VDC4_9MAGN